MLTIKVTKENGNKYVSVFNTQTKKHSLKSEYTKFNVKQLQEYINIHQVVKV